MASDDSRIAASFLLRVTASHIIMPVQWRRGRKCLASFLTAVAMAANRATGRSEASRL